MAMGTSLNFTPLLPLTFRGDVPSPHSEIPTSGVRETRDVIAGSPAHQFQPVSSQFLDMLIRISLLTYCSPVVRRDFVEQSGRFDSAVQISF